MVIYKRIVYGLRTGIHNRLLTTSQSALAGGLEVALVEQQMTCLHSLSQVKTNVPAFDFPTYLL